MSDSIKSVSLDAAKDRLEATLERLNILVTEKNSALMLARAAADERDRLLARIEQLENINAELDMAVAHQALHHEEEALNKQAIIQLEDKYKTLKNTHETLQKSQESLQAVDKKHDDLLKENMSLKTENESLKQELARQVRKVNALESEASTSDHQRQQACAKIDTMVEKVEKIMGQING